MLRVAVIGATVAVLGGCSTADSSSASEEEDGASTYDGQSTSLSASLPEGPPGIEGTITAVAHFSDGGETSPLKRILVEENPDQGKPENCSKSQEGCNKLYLDITDETNIFRNVGSNEENLAQATSTDFEMGQRVRAWHEDVVTRSYPGQTRAQVVVIDEANATFERTTDSGSPR
jgi:hypothetical protein